MSNMNISKQSQYSTLGTIPNSSNLLALKTSANVSGNVKLIDVQIDENGEYEAPKGYAYKSVQVDVDPKSPYTKRDTVITVDLSEEGAPLEFTLYHYWGSGQCDWGDGVVENFTDAWAKGHKHIYNARGVYTITVLGGHVEQMIGFGNAHSDYKYVKQIDFGYNISGPTFSRQGSNMGTQIGIPCASRYSKGATSSGKAHAMACLFSPGCDFDLGDEICTLSQARSIVCNVKSINGDNITPMSCTFMKLPSLTYVSGIFYDMTNIMYLEFGESPITLNWGPWHYCHNTLRTLVCRSETPISFPNFTGGWTKLFKPNDFSVRVPENAVDRYRTAPEFSLIATHIIHIGSAWDKALAGDPTLLQETAASIPPSETSTSVQWPASAKNVLGSEADVLVSDMAAKNYVVTWVSGY